MHQLWPLCEGQLHLIQYGEIYGAILEAEMGIPEVQPNSLWKLTTDAQRTVA
jgi:hypothetical protein